MIGDIQIDWKQKYVLETYNGDWKQRLYIQISEMSLETKSPISKQSIEIGNIFQLKIFRFSFLIKRKSRNPAYVSDLIDSFKATYCVSNLISLFPNDGYLFRILV